jgi:hypothetical protein
MTSNFVIGSTNCSAQSKPRFTLCAATILVLAVIPGLTSAAPLTWNGVTGDWTVGSNWSPAGEGPPGAGDVAIVNAGNAQLNSNATILGLTLGGGVVSGTGLLTLTGASTWTSGTQSGTGTSQFDSTLAISGTTSHGIIGGRIINASDTNWSGNTGNNNNAIAISNASIFNNTGTFTDANTFNSAINVGGGGGTFNNNGTYNKQSNTTTSITTAFNNTGTVNVNAGTFLPGGGGTSTGTYNIANGAKLELRNGAHTLNNVTTSGAGTFQISTENVGADASVVLNGGTHTTAFLLSGSTLSGTNHTFQGPATWTGGTITGPNTASTTFGNTLTISGPTGKTLSGGRIINAGDTTWSGNTGANNNAIAIATASVFNSTGTFTDANTFDSIINVGGGGGTFNNNGTFNKQSDTTTSINVAFNNTGTVNVNAGTFLPGGGGTSTGTYNIANGAKLELRNGAHTLNNVTTSGAGTFQISTENVGADASVVLNGGTHTTAFLLSGSTLSGTNHTFQGPATWTGGTITGPNTASTTFGNTLTISGTNTKTLSGGRIINAGDTTWSGNTGANNNAIAIATASVFNSNGTFTDANTFDSAINVGGGGGAFNNNGTFIKQSNTTTSISTVFNNTGVVNVNAGTFLPGGGGTDTGIFNIADGAKLEFRNGNHTLNNVTTSGLGTFQISTENVGADASVIVNGGTHTTPFLLSGSGMGGTDHTFQGPVTWTGGSIGGDGLTTFESTTFANAVTTISGPNLKTLVGGRTLNLEGTTTWSGNTANNNNAIRFWNGATLNNNGTFNDENAFNSFIEHNVGGPHNFNNVGTYNKQSNTTTLFDLGVNFNNSGNVNVNAGTMQVTNAFDNQGTITTASAATFATTSTAADMQNHGVLQGTGTYDPGTGRAVLNAGQVQPGTSTTVGDLTVTGNYTQILDGLIEFDLASLLNFDTLDVLGNLDLAGTLSVSSLGGYNPTDGDTFTIITFNDGDDTSDPSDITGIFTNLIWSGFDPGVTFTAQYFDHSVVLQAGVEPVPVPAAVWLFGSGLVGLIGVGRRRGKA